MSAAIRSLEHSIESAKRRRGDMLHYIEQQKRRIAEDEKQAAALKQDILEMEFAVKALSDCLK